MKRHESIAAISREHHFGLLFCWKIRQGLKKQVQTQRIFAYVKHFWDNHLQDHFKAEEELLFPALQDKLSDQAIAEHRQIRQLIEAMSGARPAQPQELTLLAGSVDKHIRFEERVLFPHIETELQGEALTEIGNRIHSLHHNPGEDNYSDEFWK